VTEIVSVPTEARGVTCRVHVDALHLCPHVDEIDQGTVTASWAVDGTTIELHSLAARIASYADTKISHEDLTADLAGALRAHVVGVSVTTTWRTAGLEMVVQS
jgi:NADPH-dependent 7-cyano-7-deazaguanine reductase QueF